MARQPRITPPGVALHIIQRGNNRQLIFSCDSDRFRYLQWLIEYADEYEVAIHAWVLMTNHVHLLVTPNDSKSVPKTMQALGRQYVKHFNRRYDRTGTLFEGRYRSCLVANDSYLLACYRYIEMNPVRAAIVNSPSDYFWSSHSSNAFGRHSELLSPHSTYLGLGRSPRQRQATYRKLFERSQKDVVVEEIRAATNRGLALGSNHFKCEIESNFSCRVTPGPRGRPAATEKLL